MILRKLSRTLVQRVPDRWRTIAPKLAVGTVLVTSQLAPVAQAQTKWDQMDYGPFLSSSVTLPWSTDPESLDAIVLKAVTFRFGTNGAACFDTGELRWAGAWTGGWLELHGTPFDGNHRPPEKSRPLAIGKPIFGTSHGPGWSSAGDWRDPRPEPYVPLPQNWARYAGMDVRGDRTAVRYTVGTTEVTEVPSLESADGITAFARHITLAPHRSPLSLLVAELRLELRNRVGFTGAQASDDSRVALLGDLAAVSADLPAGARWEVQEAMRLVLHLPAASKRSEFTVSVGRMNHASARRFVSAPGRSQSMAAASPKAESITTQGRLGNTGGAYEVDLLTAPDDNPQHSWMRFGGFDFFKDGRRAALCTWSGEVWIVAGIDEKLERLEWRRFAQGLFQPLGLKIVDEKVYVLGRDQITRLGDTDGDGVADRYENFNNEVSITPNFHEFALDLHTDPAGNFYFNKGAPLLGTEYWDPTSAHNGCTLRVSRDGRKLERYATGLRAPNGLGVGPRGEVTSADNEGIWTPVCRLNWMKPGGFYGAVGMDHGAVAARGVSGWDPEDFTPRYPDPRYDPPLCWLPFAIDNSAGSQVWATGNRFGPLGGELIHLSYGKCRAFHVLRQEVDGVMQGGVVPLPWRFESSAARGRMNPRDGQLYVCGLKGWQTTAARDGAFHRVRYTGREFPTVASLQVDKTSAILQFTAPLDRGSVEDEQSWNLQRWNYKWSQTYGSDLYSVATPGKLTGRKGELKGDGIPLKAVRLSADGRVVTLEMDRMVPVMQWMVKAQLKARDGADVPVEYYGTINRVPGR